MPTGIFIFLAILSVVVFVHELGHLLAAKLFGVLAEEFGIGMPPRITRLFKRGETEYTLNWLPIGGFVRLYGENGEISPEIADKRAFWSKPIWQRAIILLAGVFMNFTLGTVLFGVVYTTLGIPTPGDKVTISGVEAGGPADTAGVKAGDRLKQLTSGKDSLEVKSAEGAVTFLYDHQGKTVDVVVVREEKDVTLKVESREDPKKEKGVFGVVLDDVELKHYPLWQMPFRGIWFGLREAVAWGREIATGLVGIVVNLVSGRRIPEGLAGPIGIYTISNQVAKEGWLVTLKFIGVLSINLAILNVLPIPALDGGRVFFLGVEAILKRRIAQEIEGWVNTVGMIFLLIFMAAITINDLSRINAFGKLIETFSGFLGR